MPTDLFEDMAASLFDGPLSVEATYTPQGGNAATLRIVPDLEDASTRYGAAAFVTGAFTFRAAVPDLDLPAAGDSLSWAGRTFTVQGTPAMGPRHLWWEIEAHPNAD
jgi:hypothetical protein